MSPIMRQKDGSVDIFEELVDLHKHLARNLNNPLSIVFRATVVSSSLAVWFAP